MGAMNIYEHLPDWWQIVCSLNVPCLTPGCLAGAEAMQLVGSNLVSCGQCRVGEGGGDGLLDPHCPFSRVEHPAWILLTPKLALSGLNSPFPHSGSSDFTKMLPSRGTGSPTQPLLFKQTRLHLEDEQSLL